MSKHVFGFHKNVNNSWSYKRLKIINVRTRYDTKYPEFWQLIIDIFYAKKYIYVNICTPLLQSTKLLNPLWNNYIITDTVWISSLYLTCSSSHYDVRIILPPPPLSQIPWFIQEQE